MVSMTSSIGMSRRSPGMPSQASESGPIGPDSLSFMGKPPARVIHHQIPEIVDLPDLTGQYQHRQVVVLDECRPWHFLLRRQVAIGIHGNALKALPQGKAGLPVGLRRCRTPRPPTAAPGGVRVYCEPVGTQAPP